MDNPSYYKFMPFQSEPLRERAAMYRAIRVYFDYCGYMEADTPVLTPTPIPESHIELFQTDRLLPDGTFTPLYLVPSPEVWLKLLLASGAPSLYQIGKCFRNGEQIDLWHRIEFTMLEWYGLNESAMSNLRIMQEILITCVQAVNPDAAEDVCGTIREMTMEEAFLEFAGFSLETDLRESGLADIRRISPEHRQALNRVIDIFTARLKERNLPAGNEGTETADDLFHRLFLSLVEEALPADRPLALTHWPALVPTLARSVPETPWAERWELYIRGVEVANCYGEETEEGALRAYWDAETAKISSATDTLYSNTEWPKRIAEGMPSCSGTAVGLDRLLALIRGDTDLKGLDLFPIHDILHR